MSERSPAWFAASRAVTSRSTEVRVHGVSLRVRSWGEPGRPPIVLLHGGAAHAGWWSPLAPLLLPYHHVVAPDLSGHGDSGWREAYTLSGWRDEVVAVVDALLPGERPLVVGHSMGGIVGLLVAEAVGADLSGVLVVDSEVPPNADDYTRPEWTPPRERVTYTDRESIVRRFRTLPASAPRNPYLRAFVAEQSVVEIDGGWTWKFDPAFLHHDRRGLDDLRPLPDCPVVTVRGDDGLMDESMATAIGIAVGQPRPPVTIADAGHHVLLDQPLALAAVIAQAASAWSIPTALDSHRQ